MMTNNKKLACHQTVDQLIFATCLFTVILKFLLDLIVSIERISDTPELLDLRRGF